MTFQNPSAFILILIIPIAIVFLIWRNRLYWARIRMLGDTGLIDRLLPLPDKRRVWRAGLWLVCVAALIVALARPVWGVNRDVIEIQGVSVIVVLDVSNSMGAQDILPSRLERAKIALRQFFQEMRGNEIALILFAGSAFVYFPLTTDVDTAASFLTSVGTHAISAQGTVLAEAVHLSLDTFDPQRPASRVILLMSDGESHQGDLQPAIDRANGMGAMVYAVGYGGEEGAPVPVLNDRGEVVTYKADTAGQLVMTFLDEQPLRTISEQTGGFYQRATGSQSEIANLVQAIKQAEQGVLDNRVEVRGIERFGIFLFIALIALTLEMLLPARRERPLI